MKRYQEATIFFLQVTLVGEFMGKGLRNKIVEPGLGLGFSLVNANLSSLMNETKTFNLVKCEWLQHITRLSYRVSFFMKTARWPGLCLWLSGLFKVCCTSFDVFLDCCCELPSHCCV